MRVEQRGVVGAEARAEHAERAADDAVLEGRLAAGDDLGAAVVGVARAAQAPVHRRDHRDRVQAGAHVQLRREAHLEVAHALGLVVLGELARDALERLGVLHHARPCTGSPSGSRRGWCTAPYIQSRAGRPRCSSAVPRGAARASSISVGMRSDPSRWTCRSVFGSSAMNSRVIGDSGTAAPAAMQTRSITRRRGLPVNSRSVATIETKSWTRVIRNATLATCAPGKPYGLIPRGAIALAGNRIAWVGKNRDAARRLCRSASPSPMRAAR